MARPGSGAWALLACAALGAPATASAEEAAGPAPIQVNREVGAQKQLHLEAGQNRLLVLSEQVGRVAVADPRVADLKVITPTQILLTARAVGTTDLTLWNKQEEPLVLALQVTRNLEPLRRQIRDLFPGEKITVASAGELVVLAGEASDVRIPERVAEVAALHAEKVANLIQVTGDEQVQLEVRFAEVSRRGLRQMGLNFFHVDEQGQRVGGLTPPGVAPAPTMEVPGTSPDLRPGLNGAPALLPPNFGNAFSLFFSNLPGFPFSAVVSLLESNGLAKILAEPTLVAMSGQEAKFLAGGEFPVPIAAEFGRVGVLWKKFGIILSFTPTVLGQGTIQLRLAAEVSDVDPSRQIVVGGFAIPGLTSRQSETTVRLSDGESFAIAGLLSNQVRSQIDRIPLLGELPILGALFRSIDYRRDESELLVVVTARLAKPLAPHEVPPLPTEDELNDPNDFSLFLLGSEGRGAPERAQSGQQAQQAEAEGRGPSGELGFVR